MKTPPPKPTPSGPPSRTDANGNSGFGATNGSNNRKKKPSPIQGLAGAMANAAIGSAKSMAGTAGRVAQAPGNVARSMAGTAGRVGRAVNPKD